MESGDESLTRVEAANSESMTATSVGLDYLVKRETNEDESQDMEPVSPSSSKEMETKPENDSKDLIFRCNCDDVFTSVEDFHSHKTKFCKTKSRFCMKCPLAGCSYKVTISGKNLGPLEVLCDHMRSKHTRETVHSCTYCSKGIQ